MKGNITGLSRRSLLTKAAVGIPAMGVVGALAWANPAAAPKASASFVDGYWGSSTTLMMQHYYRLSYRDGVISGQEPRLQSVNPGLTSGWDWSDASGSTTIKSLQKHMNQWGYGLHVDGVMGPSTIWHLHKWFHLSPKDYLAEADSCIAALQSWLNRQFP